ncbi:terminase large subunit domain-containing protein [Paenibacillus sp. L3-i20]|uniref:terminase large subunit domain-containing protein n=1 Tax=Paenibacillus sp. L3-i20 TaxID=2905833 RepID=UPI001EDDCE2E|nr:terminase family protein [Paenibacillus sp. L3-i20]GKU76851.1 DNA packaging protein [Paenibacillus sp. L3-i20]
MKSSMELRSHYKQLTLYRQELERRLKEEGIRYYRPHQKQQDFHRSTLRNRWVFGGNRTGKTVSGGAEAVWYATGNHPHKKIKTPNRGWVVSLTNEVQRDVAQREVLRWLPKNMIADVQMRKGTKDSLETGIIDFIQLTNGSLIGFKSCDQGRAKFQGTSQHWIWFDEEPPEDVYSECKMRVLDTVGDMWGTMTPLQGLTWVYDVIYMNEPQDKEVKYWLIQWADNPHLSREAIAQLESTMSDEEREARQYGKFVAMSGLVYKEFVEDIHVIDPFDVPRSWYDNISIDPGLDAPLSAHFYAVDGDNNIYVIEEHYQSGQSVEWHAEQLHAIANRLGWPKRNGVLDALIDSAANQRTLAAERTVTELFYEHDVLADTGVEKDIWTGLQRVKQYLKLRDNPQVDVWPRGKPKLFIFRNCVQMIREIKSYRWKPDEDKPIKKNDHAMDDLKYYIMSRPDIVLGGPVEQNAMSHTKQLKQEHLPYALRDNDTDDYDWHDL